MNKMGLLWKFMKGNRILYLGAILSIGFATLFSFISPLIIRVTIDSIIGNKPMELPAWLEGFAENLGGREFFLHNLWICGLLLILAALGNGIFTYYKGKWSAVASESIAKKMREELYNHLQHVSYDYHVKAETGDLIQRCTSDVETVRQFLAVQFVEIGRALFMVALALAIMLSLDKIMTLVAMAVVPVIFVFAFVFFIKVQKVFQLSDEAEGRLSTTLQENLTGVRVVRAFARQQHEIEKFDAKNAHYRDITYKLIRLLAWYWASSDFICMLQIGVLLILGTYWAATGAITLGTLVVFMTYEGMLLWPVRQMGRILTNMGKTIVSLGRIKEILDEPIETSKEGLKPNISGYIEFNEVYFGYEEGKEVLKGISFKAQKGQTIAILGATGSGKSSLIHLLPRLYEYSKGSIKIDGIELKDIDKKWIRSNIGIVLQEPFLFSKTIRENISLAKADAEEIEVFEAARVAAIHDVIMDFEKGYETVVGERGVTLSGGQKQRVAIARAIIKNAPILIFDDSLSAVDTETDKAIREAMAERKKDATTFIISHRITTLKEADLILVMEDGTIVQQGTHEELVKVPGLYQRIWQIQSDLEYEINNAEDTEKSA